MDLLEMIIHAINFLPGAFLLIATKQSNLAKTRRKAVKRD